MSPSKHPETAASDLSILAHNPALAELTQTDIEILLESLDQFVIPPGEAAVREGDTGEHMFFILDGRARITRGQLELQSIGPSQHFGELALLGVHRRAATVEAMSPLRLARLSREDYLKLAEGHPRLVVRLLQSLLDSVGRSLVAMTDSVDRLLGERLLPRRTTVRVSTNGTSHEVPTGTKLSTLLSTEHEGALVVAGLLDGRLVGLTTPVVSDAWISPVTIATWEGRAVLRRSAGLLLLEAAAQVAPDVPLRLGAGLEYAQHIEPPKGLTQFSEMAERLDHALRVRIEQEVVFREENWTVEEARAELLTHGQNDAAALLSSFREATVPLSSCGRLYALSNGPLVPHAGILRGTRVIAHPRGLMLVFGEDAVRHVPGREDGEAELAVEAQRPRFGGDMVDEQRRFCEVLDATSVGSFNQTCISGRVAELIRVTEGFHEKRIGRLADEISERASPVRIITIAGPSSSGKTTFIKRLTTQLEINGKRPLSLSLDDYYVDRELTPKDEQGEYDFEALEALDLAVLQRDIAQLLTGARLKTPHFDFKLGKSIPFRGPELELGPDDVLLVEGIHGLNPTLFGDAVNESLLFRIFIHPASTLPLDRLSPVSPHDLRLIRRIVRDRHTRGLSAADNILRWPSVRRGELMHIYPFLPFANAVFDSALVYEPSVLKVFADRYLLEVPSRHVAHTTAHRLRQLLDRYVTIYPDHVPPTSILREFIGGSGFEY